MTYQEDLPVKALSIRQPWVWAILNAGKRIENRPRRFHYRGPICLHASQYDRLAEYETLSDHVYDLSDGFMPPRSPELGGIIGTADIVDCVEASDSPWFFGPFGLVLENVKPTPFIPVKGALGLFDWRKKLENTK